jgi:hypothetical protein
MFSQDGIPQQSGQSWTISAKQHADHAAAERNADHAAAAFLQREAWI